MESGFSRLGKQAVKNRPLAWAADGLFPHFCAGCGREGTVLCKTCFVETRARVAGFFVCPACATPTPLGQCCGRRACRRRTSLDGLISATSYADVCCRELLHQYKYEGVDEAGEVLALLVSGFADGLKPVFNILGFSAVVSLPLHPFRFALRGFNQAARFGRALSEVTGHPHVSGLVLRKFLWRRQVQMKDDDQRRANAVRSFCVPRSVAVPENVMLVDDVFTTGATLNACATELKKAGAKKVWAFTVLRG